MDFASPDDVAVVWRPLSDDETATVAAMLRFVSATVRRRLPDVDDRAATDGTLQDILRGVVAGVVARAMRNPAGVRSETDGSMTTVYADTSSGGLSLSADEWALLEPASSDSAAFTIVPAGTAPRWLRPDRYGTWW